MGKAATAAAGTTGQAAQNAVTPAVTNTINAGAGIADDVALATTQPSIATNAGLGGMQNVGLTQGAGVNGVDFTGKLVDPRGLSTFGQSVSLPPTQTFADTVKASQGLNAATPPADRNSFEMFRDYVDAKPGSTTAKALNFAADNPEITAAGLGGTYGLMQPRKIPKLEEEEESKLHGYDPDNFTPYIPKTPNPYYKPKYAEGGIAALANGGMGSNMGYPQGRLDTTQYATPSQMPTSAEVVNSDYEMRTDPYMGSPLKMAGGGYATSFYELQNGYGSPTGNMGRPSMGAMSGFSLNPGANGNSSMFHGYLNNTPPAPPPLISDDFQATQATPNIYQPSYASMQAEQTPMTGYNPSAVATAAQSVSSPAYDAMMQGVAPQDFNRLFSQIMGKQPQAAPVAVKAPQEKQMASGGIAGYSLGGYAAGGNPRLLKGPGDGMSDNIPATIGGRQPARLADGEFVVPADVVSHLGNGSTDAGAKHLYKMMDKVRTARTGKKAQGKQIKPEKFMPR
jgi:hypothetical protein